MYWFDLNILLLYTSSSNRKRRKKSIPVNHDCEVRNDFCNDAEIALCDCVVQITSATFLDSYLRYTIAFEGFFVLGYRHQDV